jgi:hypothetical protein
MPGSTMRAIGTDAGSSGSARSFSTPIHSDCTSFNCGSLPKVPAGGAPTIATSMSSRGSRWNRSRGSARSSSGSQRSAGSIVEA